MQLMNHRWLLSIETLCGVSTFDDIDRVRDASDSSEFSTGNSFMVLSEKRKWITRDVRAVCS